MRVKVEVNKKLNREQRKLLEEFGRTADGDTISNQKNMLQKIRESISRPKPN